MAKRTYVDGFVLSIPKKNTAKYKKLAEEASRVWKRFGALNYKECILDDLTWNALLMRALKFRWAGKNRLSKYKFAAQATQKLRSGGLFCAGQLQL